MAHSAVRCAVVCRSADGGSPASSAGREYTQYSRPGGLFRILVRLNMTLLIHSINRNRQLGLAESEDETATVRTEL